MSRMHGSKDMWLAALRDDGPAFLDAATAADPAATVPSRPEWTVADLIHHLGSVYRFVHALVGRGVTGKPDRSLGSFLDEARPDDLVGWWREQYEATLGTLEGADPDLPAWNWAPQAKTAAFWQRRAALDTAVHRWDAQMASGRAEPVETKLAADGVTEVLDTWLPAGRRVGPTDVTGVVGLDAPDVGYVWHVRLRGEGVALLDTDTILDPDDFDTRTLATGPASDLMLALHGRVGLDVLEITGDERLLEAVRVG
jgi:uncharacterized protein (TIGR03083 family)